MKNFFRTSVLVLPLLLPMTVYGVDLGALHTLSKQGEPLDARVALSGVEDIKLNDLKVKLANNHDLGIAGVKGLENYGDVSVELVAESRDKIQAVVRTSQPVDQSYVSFLLEVRWPSGRLMREYTGLLKQGESKPQNVQPVVIQALDGEKETFSVVNAPTPKAAMSETTAVVVNPVVNVDVKPVDNVTHVKPVAPVTPVTIQAVQPAVHVEQQKQPIAVSLPKPVLPVMTDVEPAQSIVVKPKQTLWDIALNANLTGKYTNQQVALAIFENNRTAFKNGDINQLKKSANIVLPSESMIEKNDPHTALVTLRSHINPHQPPVGEWVTVERVQVQPKETLWDIAVRHRATPYVNTRQLMLAIVRKNPSAFAQNNVNGMRKGVTLIMPTKDEILAVSPEQASREVRRQIASWNGQNVPTHKPQDKPSENVKMRTTDVTHHAPAPLSNTAITERILVTVKPKETAWSLAVNHLPGEDVKVGDMIRALIQLNPEAFPNGDMNALEVGKQIQIPNRNDIIGALNNTNH